MENNLIVNHLDGEFGLTNKIRSALNESAKQFVYIGFLLKEADEFCYYREGGYEDIYEYCEDNFGFGRSSTNNFIRVYRQFGSNNGIGLLDSYKAYSYSQLTEMCSMNMKQLNECNPEMTVRELRAVKKGKIPVEMQKVKDIEVGANKTITLDSVQTSGIDCDDKIHRKVLFNFLLANFVNEDFIFQHSNNFRKSVVDKHIFETGSIELRMIGKKKFWLAFKNDCVQVSVDNRIIDYDYTYVFFHIKRMIESNYVSVDFPREFIIEFFNKFCGGISDDWDIRFFQNLGYRNDEFVEHLFNAIGYSR